MVSGACAEVGGRCPGVCTGGGGGRWELGSMGLGRRVRDGCAGLGRVGWKVTPCAWGARCIVGSPGWHVVPLGLSSWHGVRAGRWERRGR